MNAAEDPTAGVLRAVALSYCTALLAEPADAPPGRFFAAYRARRGYRWLLGQAVVDEFATISSPLFAAPIPLLGKVYDAGLTLGFRRDKELPLDAGWPPVCLGVEAPAPELAAGWQEDLLGALGAPRRGATAEAAGAAGPELTGGQPPPPGPAAWRPRLRTTAVGRHRLTRAEIGSPGEVVVVATDAPLLPEQLGRLCDETDASLVFALATGNRLTRSADGSPLAVTALAESGVTALAKSLRRT